MRTNVVPVRLRTCDIVRIDTRRYIVGPPGDQFRVFTEQENGNELPIRNDALMSMIRAGRITTDAAYRALSPDVVENLNVSWDAFSDLERISAQQKAPYVKAMHKLAQHVRDRTKLIDPLIDHVWKDPRNSYPRKKRPRARLVRDWYTRWVVAGKDIRALVDNHRNKGNRTDRYNERVRTVIHTAIMKKFAPDHRDAPPGTKAMAHDAAVKALDLLIDEQGWVIPENGADGTIGKHLVARTIDKMDQYGLMVRREGQREADLWAKAVRNGPNPTRPLEEVEVDHTRLDMLVCDKEGNVLPRPWITTIMDRYSRMILGFSISFTAPSWVSVMEAMRIALQPKEAFLESVCRAIGKETKFEFQYPAFGTWERMYVDNGPEFRSASMKATEGPLNMTIVDLPRAAGWLKGRIESWFRTFNLRLVHGLPGTTKSNPAGRGNYKSEKHAYLTLDEVIWIVTKWIVDEYHATTHGETGETPLLMYERGIAESGQPAPPPIDLIAPITGVVVNRKLTRDGIFWKKLRWQSDEFSALLNRTTKLATGRGKRIKGQIMTVRLDPLDLKKIYVLDPTREGKRNAWIEGDLETDDPNILNMTLAQYEEHRKAKRKNRAPYDRENAVKRARASRDIAELLESKRPAKAVPAKLRHLRTEGRNASHHVRGSRYSAEESRLPVGSHDHHDPKLLSPPPDPRGPYRERSFDPMSSDALEAPIQPLDTEAFNETKRDADRAAASAEPTKPKTRPMVVKFLPKRK